MSEIKCEIIKKVGVVSSPLPSSPKCGEHEFGGGEHDVGMNIFIYAQVEHVPPPFLSCILSRGTNGGG